MKYTGKKKSETLFDFLCDSERELVKEMFFVLKKAQDQLKQHYFVPPTCIICSSRSTKHVLVFPTNNISIETLKQVASEFISHFGCKFYLWVLRYMKKKWLRNNYYLVIQGEDEISKLTIKQRYIIKDKKVIFKNLEYTKDFLDKRLLLKLGSPQDIVYID